MFAKLKKHSEIFEESLRTVDKELENKSAMFFSILTNEVNQDALLFMENMIRDLNHIKSTLSDNITDYKNSILDAEDRNGEMESRLKDNCLKLDKIKHHLTEFGFECHDSQLFPDRISKEISFDETNNIEPNDTFNFL